ncbi:hypothetical protein ZHAS_00017420 [Anopheles sinensis]|uniref:Uncharacterized protein n=1 Tax=Anopheles sinensis TaxID=74873 RepID=A0A084WGG0_ANOSI|nr:hypothetical protein ZHAS_00017420 [Anopheles sinensis]
MKCITVLCILGVMLSVLEATDAADSTTAAPEADKKDPTTEAGKGEEADAGKADGTPDAESSGKGDPSEFIRKLIQSAVSKMTSDVKKRLEVIPFTLLKK